MKLITLSKFKIYKTILNFLNANKIYRKFLLILIDYLSIYISWLLSILIIKDFNNNINLQSILYHFWAIQLFAAPVYLLSNQYKPLTRFINNSSFYFIFSRNVFLISIPILYLDIARFQNTKITFWLIFLLITIIIQIGYRLLIRDLINYLIRNIKKNKLKRAAIYKADYLGFQLSNILQIEGKYSVVCFLDDSPSLDGSSINSIPIKNISKFDNNKYKIDDLIISSYSTPISKLKKYIEKFEMQGIKVRRSSPLEFLKDENSLSKSIKNISQSEILGRESVQPSEKLIKASINKEISVCITGAGGSIGSELCRQIIHRKPKFLIMIDFSEYNLFKISEELKELNITETISIAKLINAEDRISLEETFREYNVNLIFHAAAYKHVGLVEMNPIEGLKNNLLTTKSICEAAIKTKVKKMILISSDKAVRPTNIMGGSKLLSELLVKKIYGQSNKLTKFAVVRFGNVIDSSGSVIPIFRDQIKNGGPLTITHPEMERFFMTISEAVQLVLQSSVLAKGGETFILNMGEPIKIIDIAKKMIYLSGLKIKDKNHKFGDIEIKIIGIKKGEKLKEELLINGSIESTVHPLINKAREKIFVNEDLINKIYLLIEAAKNNNREETLYLYKKIMETYKS